MGLRYEAWTTPWNPGGFIRKWARIPVEEDSGQGDMRFLSTAGQGSMTVINAENNRLGEIVGPSVNSLIRVYDNDELIHEWLCERAPKDLSDEARRADLSGPGLEAIFDRYIIYPREYPDDFTGVQDTIWAGDNVLDNPDFEEADTQSEQYELWLHATGGDYTLTVMGQTTAAIAFGASGAILESRLQDLSNVDDVLVTVGDTDEGTEDNPYKIEFIVPALVDPNMSIDDTGLTGLTGQGTITVIQEGRDDIPRAWTPSQFADRRQDPRFHGRLSSDGFRLDDSITVFNGLLALRINPLEIYGGAQQIVRVEPGMTYQGKIRVYTTDATEVFKFIARNAYVDGEAPGLAQDGGSIPASTWTEFSFELFVPQGVDTIIFRIAAVGNDNPIPFWIDGAELREGFAAATPGEILTVLMDDATTDHAADPRGAVLEWIDYSGFDAVNDSNGTPWTETISFTAQFGETYGQILDKLVDRGYEWRLVAKAAPVGVLTHDLELYLPGGRDDAPGVGINTRGPVIGGDVNDRSPEFTAVFLEGMTSFVEVEDAVAVGNFGRFETFIAARDVPTNDDLTQIGNAALAAEEINRKAVRFEVADMPGHDRPLVHYRLGDTVSLQAPPNLDKEDRRIQEISYVNTNPTTYQLVGSRSFIGEAAAYDLIRRLWRRFSRPETPRRRGAVEQNAKGGQTTYTIAASDSTQADKDKADVTAMGASDHELINSYLIGLTGTGGLVTLTDGTFVTSGKILVPSRVALRGHGHGTHIDASVSGDWAVEGAEMSIIEDMDVSNPTGSGVRLLGPLPG